MGDIDITFRPITKVNKRNMAMSKKKKKNDDGIISTNYVGETT